MTITLDQLALAIKPANTALLLGAGATAPSGAPTGAQLATFLWKEVAKEEAQSDDLIDTSSILVRRFGRRPVIEAIVAKLRPLRPTGGPLAMPSFAWRGIYSTNYDMLVESAYRSAKIPLAAIRSNYDLTYREDRTSQTLYKIHGCISQDTSLGHKGSMILTEQDYEDYKKYRQSLFSSFDNSLMTGDVLILGQSLRDKHLAEYVKAALSAKDQGLPGNVYVLTYDPDDLRAPLLEDRGAKICFGGIGTYIRV